MLEECELLFTQQKISIIISVVCRWLFILLSCYIYSGTVVISLQALETRRARLGETEGQEVDSPRPPDPSLQLSGASLEQRTSLATPSPSIQKKLCPPSVGKVPKILLNITNNPSADGSSEFLTPQKKLLNQIDTVEKEVMEELKKLKRTPSAKKAVREKRVRTLQSMR